MKKILFLEHIDFETPALLLDWAKKENFEYERLFLYDNSCISFPDLESFDILVVMGGPMNIYEVDSYPWLKEEKTFIKRCISKNKKVLGLCLGAQLIADCLGAKIVRNANQEIGFFPLSLTKAGKQSSFFKNFPNNFHAVHWHGDTFEIPENAELLCSSEACRNQAFSYNQNVLALQFHLELNYDSLKVLCKNDPPQKNTYVQSANEITDESNLHYLDKTQKLLDILMRNFLEN